ncbi:MAG TPA: RagB/SusD family nutrient uptake outer membrane protein [Kofleriaceae bacterium]|jgi:hypothetical protein|nr:RagB/SusD family nutrient uptake outer membrane protein [Kofleriaceae bacterium]
MRNQSLATFALGSILGTLALSACNLDVPDLNNASLTDLENNPTAISVGAAATGLLIGNRGNHALENGYVVQLGILGREAYNFDNADPRFVGELLVGALNPGSPFGGNFWSLEYANIELGNIITHALDKLPSSELTDVQKSGVLGFTHTIQALDLLEVIATHDTNGAVIDTDHDPLAPLGAIVDKPTTYAKIVDLLDTGNAELAAAGSGLFPFELSKGFEDFAAPSAFTKLNRAIRARVAAYLGDYPTVLTALADSFLVDNLGIDLDAGVFYTYTTKSGDATNQLLNPNIYVHPSIATDAQPGDMRLIRKTILAAVAGKRDATLKFALYPDPDSSVSLIRNEELILLKAEALYMTGMTGPALAELNLVRTQSGGLPALTGTPDMATFVTELLYEREFSLLFEGHRWIDARRLGQLAKLPIYVTVDPDTNEMTPDTLNVRYPIPLPECNARPGEPRCTLGSTDSM